MMNLATNPSAFQMRANQRLYVSLVTWITSFSCRERDVGAYRPTKSKSFSRQRGYIGSGWTPIHRRCSQCSKMT